ncbi:MAG TPA: imidazolonepropionase [Thermoanaerobaculia bacterium]|nr:imidazolonepropionase [Thermoanaerobaculia bacterium]
MAAHSLEIRNAACLATPLGSSAKRGREQGEILRIRDAALRAEDGRIVFAGTEADYRREFGGKAADARLDASGKTILPGFVDAHTHPVWAGDRGAEIGRRLAGETYAAIAAEGGGILATVRATRAASDEELERLVRERLGRMLSCGTTTAEAKSGYGLTAEEEIRALRLLARIESPDLPRVVPTLLAAHEIPPEYRDDRREWVRVITEQIIPPCAREKLARFCDVFCETGVFTVNESWLILKAARRAGLGLRIHADELALSGGAKLAAELRADSADHLLHVGAKEIEALAAAGTVAVVLPGTAWWMQSKPAPARAMIEAGVPVAVATDANPGTCNSESLPAAATHACLDSKFTVEEALTAITLNAAASLGLAGEIGSLEPGKRADVVLLDAPDDRHLIYHWGVNLAGAVIRGGRVVRGGPPGTPA